jgi:hypothetical protein
MPAGTIEGIVYDGLLTGGPLKGATVYPGFAGAPAFALGDGNACGTIIVWTRRGI